MLMTPDAYRESLRALSPAVYINGESVDSVADEPLLAPGVNGIALTYELAQHPQHAKVMAVEEQANGLTVNRFTHINRTSQDLLDKLEATRLACQYAGCAQRYLQQDALNAVFEATFRIEADGVDDRHQRFLAYLKDVQEKDLTLGAAMTDTKGDRSKRPGEQTNKDMYVHIAERRADGIVIRGAKAIVTGAPYVHEYLVMPCRAMTEAESDFAVACAVPIDAEGVTVIARPAGRPGQPGAKFSAVFAQSVGVVHFDNVFVPWEKVFVDGQVEAAKHLTHSFASHHRHSCIGARAGFGDLLIGAGALMLEANGLSYDSAPHLADRMTQLIRMVEGFYACGVASCVYGDADESGTARPHQVFANVGKLLLANQIYDMHKIAHEVSGGLVVALPEPDEDHNPATAGSLADLLKGRDDIPYEQRANVARLIEDLTASYTGGWYSVISLHGGGSPAAMELEILRNYPIPSKQDLVQRLLDRGVLAAGDETAPDKDPGRCCAAGCDTGLPGPKRSYS